MLERLEGDQACIQPETGHMGCFEGDKHGTFRKLQHVVSTVAWQSLMSSLAKMVVVRHHVRPGSIALGRVLVQRLGGV